MTIFSLLILSLILFISYSLLPLFSSANSITLPLTRIALPSTMNTTNPWENLKYLAAASLERAQHLKCPNDIHVQLYPRRVGEYTISLSFGTPPQALHFVMDTGSNVNWFPCTKKYTCTDCSSYTTHIPTFIPKSSSSYKPLACASPQCKWLSPYQRCIKNNTLCGYELLYGTGNTTGWLVSETLTFLPERADLTVHNFIIGCSVSSETIPEGGGITGFGRDRDSLPAQMGLTSFSYCMVSHDFDDDPTATSDLVLTKGGPVKGGNEVHYTPFAKNPNSSYLQNFYYVRVQSISVGGVLVKVPNKYLVPDHGGYGGTILDSGTTLTYMEKPVFDLFFKEFQKQVGNKYKRAKKIENWTGFELCYRVHAGRIIELPNLTFTFQRGVEMVLPLPNYFLYADKQRSVLCMTIMNSGPVSVGPAILLGNYQQQDYYMEYDLENNRLGIRQQKCK